MPTTMMRCTRVAPFEFVDAEELDEAAELPDVLEDEEEFKAEVGAEIELDVEAAEGATAEAAEGVTVGATDEALVEA